jgi:hypothetical protein
MKRIGAGASSLAAWALVTAAKLTLWCLAIS